MATRGRKPQPTALKKLRGNPGNRALNEAEPAFAPRQVRRPAAVQGEARLEWKRLARPLQDLGVLSHGDRANFAGYCIAWGMVVEATKALEGKGPTMLVESGDGKVTEVERPELRTLARFLDLTRKLGSEFGLTPSSRSRIIGRQPGKKRTELDGIIEE